MFRFFEPVIVPLLTAVKARVVVEVGAGKGPNTELLLAWAAKTRRKVTVHVIDPAPEFDVEELESRHDDVLRFHSGLSLDVLPTIETPDVVLLDGDHNWYTVYHELKLLERTAVEAGHPMPVVVLHDVDWPYGRRDLYYSPETIPESYRQPYRRAGLIPGHAELQDDAGINRTLANALDEDGVRNGVRTGIEDFVAESSHGYRLVNVPGNHGVGILAATQRTRSGTRLGTVLDELESTDFLRDQCLRIEEARVTATIGLADAARAHAKAERREQEAQARADALAQELEARRAQPAEATAAPDAATEELAQVRDEAETLRTEAIAATEAKHKTRAELEFRLAELAEATQARDEASEQLAQLRDEVEQREADARERVRWLEAAVAEREGEVAAARAREEQVQGESDARAEELREARADAGRLVSELERARGDLERGDSDTRTLLDQLRRLAGELDQAEFALALAVAGRAEAEDTLAFRAEAFERERQDLDAKIAANSELIRNLGTELERVQASSSQELSEARAESSRALEQANAQADEFHRERAKLTARIEVLDRERMELKERYVSTEARRAELEKTVVKRDAQLAATAERHRLHVEELSARRFELRDRTVAQVSAELDLLRGDLERVANSHAWRLGHGLMRFLRLLTFRRSRTPGGVEHSLLRLSRIDLPPRYLPPVPPEPTERAVEAHERVNGAGSNGAGATNGAGHANGGAEALSGAARLLRTGRADHTADGFILDERWQDLFTEAERQAARDRLAAARAK